MARLTKKQRQEALAQSGQAAAQYASLGAGIGGSIGAIGGVMAPAVAGIGAGIGAVTGGLGGYLRARKELLELQKMEKSQSKLDRDAEDASKAEDLRIRGALAQQFDDTFDEAMDPLGLQMQMMQPGLSSYDAYHARRYG